jgi:NitT/TauT family transport system substrate-binding protein
MYIRCFWTAISLLLSMGIASAADQVEKPKLVISAAAQTVQYLPMTLAKQLGYFKEEGLDVDIAVFAGGSKALEALMGGSSDMVSGAFQQAIAMAAKDQALKVVAAQSFSSTALVVGKDHAASFKSAKDMKGWKIGVTSPGSGTHMFLGKILKDDGLSLSDVSVIGVGAGPSAVGALDRGDVDALLHADPVLTTLQQHGHLIPQQYDSRTKEGSINVFGAQVPEAAVYTTADFVAKNPKTVQAVVNAVVKAEKWIAKATPEQVIAALPPELVQGDKSLYLESFKNSRSSISPDGRITPQEVEALVKTVTDFLPEIRAAADAGHIKADELYDMSFVEKANAAAQ